MGTYCQYPKEVYYIINDGADLAVDTLYEQYSPKINSLNEHDIIFLSNVFNGFFVDYDAISPDRTDKVMELFEGIANAPAYFVPRNVNDRRLVFDTINGFGSKLMVMIKKHFKNTDFEHSHTLHGIERENKVRDDLTKLEGLYQRYRTLLLKFIDKSALRLNPGEKKFIYTSFNYDLSLEAGYANEFVGKDVNIQSNDAFWT